MKGSESQDVPCHVGHEDVTELEVTDGIEESGDHGENEEQHWRAP
jgi:hypothetical protein